MACPCCTLEDCPSEAERDALAAQVAALVQDYALVLGSTDTEAIVANLPAAARRFLAADKACEGIDRLLGHVEAGTYNVAGDVDAELQEWRKAGQ